MGAELSAGLLLIVVAVDEEDAVGNAGESVAHDGVPAGGAEGDVIAAVHQDLAPGDFRAVVPALGEDDARPDDGGDEVRKADLLALGLPLRGVVVRVDVVDQLEQPGRRGQSGLQQAAHTGGTPAGGNQDGNAGFRHPILRCAQDDRSLSKPGGRAAKGCSR